MRACSTSFFKLYHQKIAQPYILITHSGDSLVPGASASYLDDPKLLHWFGINADRSHPKLTKIPIGLANPEYPHGNTQLHEIRKGKVYPKTIGVYANFSISTNPTERLRTLHYALTQDFVTFAGIKPLEIFMEELYSSEFVLSPPGNGLDCHRTWEALIAGGIPIVLHSSLDSLFADLPVVIVDDWVEVTPEFLNEMRLKMKDKRYKTEKIYFDYWKKEVEHARNTL